MRKLQPFSPMGLNAVLVPGALQRICRMCGERGHYEIECGMTMGDDVKSGRAKVQIAGVLAREARRNVQVYDGRSQREELNEWNKERPNHPESSLRGEQMDKPREPTRTNLQNPQVRLHRRRRRGPEGDECPEGGKQKGGEVPRAVGEWPAHVGFELSYAQPGIH
mmetsp:Transcript_10368/g.21342  ORF Transcript_10368/g.21342 Transcript_10368/m.21342 type:complete len:165 (+) Transcript_10368:486-980(+)